LPTKETALIVKAGFIVCGSFPKNKNPAKVVLPFFITLLTFNHFYNIFIPASVFYSILFNCL
jgi:hypothetical protein